MKSLSYAIVTVLCIGLVTGCAGSAALQSQHAGYQYQGEKYGRVVVTQSAAVANDSRKGVRLEEMALDTKIVTELKAAGAFDSASPNSVGVLINSIHIRNTFNAMVFGFMAGADNINGTVTLKKGDRDLARFDVTASYALGGAVGGINSTRLGWLSERFAEETVNIILGRKR